MAPLMIRRSLVTAADTSLTTAVPAMPVAPRTVDSHEGSFREEEREECGATTALIAVRVSESQELDGCGVHRR